MSHLAVVADVPKEIITALGGNHPTPQQWEAISAPLEPCVLIAGAGSGKTAVMAARIVYLALFADVHPREMLGLTFTNKAAANLRERVGSALANLGLGSDDGPTIATYHAFASMLIADYGMRAGVPLGATLITRGQARQLVAPLYGARTYHAMEVRSQWHIDWVLDLADECGNHLIDPQDAIAEDLRWIERIDTAQANGEKVAFAVKAAPPKRIELLEVVAAYRDAKAARNLMDYGDQIRLAHEIAQDPEVAAAFGVRFRTALLDEYQDTNVAQARMLRALMPNGYPVMAVGDPDQNIYAWRGASLRNLLAFPEDFRRADGEPATVRPLLVNFRSGRRILDVANAVIGSIPAAQRPGDKVLVPLPDKIGDVAVFLATDEEAEAERIATEAVAAHAAGTPWGEIAVLPRKKRLFRSLITAFRAAEVPLEVVGLGALMKMPEVTDVVAVLRVLNEPLDNIAFARLAQGPRWRLGPRDLVRLARHAASKTSALREEMQLDDTPGDVIFSLAETLIDVEVVDGLSDEARTRLADLREMLARLHALRHAPPADLVSAAVRELGIAAEIAASPSPAAPSAQRNLASFCDHVAGFRPLDGEATLATLVEWLQALDDAGEELEAAQPSEDDSVKLMTIHQAKGLEFELVFVPGLAAAGRSRIFPDTSRQANPASSPHYLPFELRGDRDVLPKFNGTLAPFKRDLEDRMLEEERRLFYVALTRAKERLVCSGAWWYHPSGMDESLRNPIGPSLFYGEVRAYEEVRILDEVEQPEVNPLVARRAQRAAAWPPPARRAPDALLPDGAAAAVRAARATTPQDETLFADVASEAPGRRGLPVSAFATYAQCPKKFYWTYERPLPRKPSAAARLGTLVHTWIERQGTGHQTLIEPDDYEVRTPQEASALATKRDVFKASRYYGRIIDHIEQPFAVVVGSHAIQGRIDAIYRDGDTFEIVDWKSGSAPGDSVGGEGWQLECYALAVQEMWNIPPERITATFVYLGYEKAEERSIVVRPAAEIRADLAVTLDAIAGKAFEPTPNPKCRSCDFLSYCEPGKAAVAVLPSH